MLLRKDKNNQMQAMITKLIKKKIMKMTYKTKTNQEQFSQLKGSHLESRKVNHLFCLE